MIYQSSAKRYRTKTAAFTLVELLLSVSLILLLATSVIVNFGTLDRGARLAEGATLVESLLRYARAQAASTGRRVKVVFGTGSGAVAQSGIPVDSSNTVAGVRVLWEPDPMGAPGKFETLAGAAQLVDQVNDIVQVRDVRPLGANTTNSLAESIEPSLALTSVGNTNAPIVGPDGMISSIPPVTCYPDGSSDSVEIVLSPQDDDDLRRSVISLSGVTGALKHRTLVLEPDGTATPQDGASPPPAPSGAPDQ